MGDHNEPIKTNIYKCALSVNKKTGKNHKISIEQRSDWARSSLIESENALLVSLGSIARGLHFFGAEVDFFGL